VERYGIGEVAPWGFEVWTEANLEAYWTGTREEYFRLYGVAVEAVKVVDVRLLVDGPATAAAGWIPDFLDPWWRSARRWISSRRVRSPTGS
jgi:xylan 1,4-beta-xylosidase